MLEGGDEYAAPYDGWDMMSGGNDVDDDMNPHFAAAAKWFYNWIPDESIIHMQPEGSTSQCPNCVSSGTFTLRPFEDPNLSPTANIKMGIHIPIAVTDNGETLYSYWLSYRGTGYDGAAANGLSVHLTWFYLDGSNYGSQYDSLNYDAFGDTETTNDSFVENGSCYHIFPSAYMTDRAEDNVNAVQPVVCVDSIDVGNKITVTVEFLDTSSPPSQQISTVDTTVKCGNTVEASVIELGSSNNSLVKIEGTGDISTSMCAASGSFSGYYYDQFPYSPLTYSSNFEYGSYLRQASSSSCSSSNYRAVNDETYILVPTSNFSGGRMEISCVKAPEDQFEERAPSKGWRLWADKSHTTSGWAWDISFIQFYNSVDCSGNAIANDGTPIHSGSYDLQGWGPQNAFTNSGAWGGRTDQNGEFFIGMRFSSTKDIKCIKFKHSGDKLANEVRVQAQNDSTGEWENAYIAKDLGFENVIEMRYDVLDDDGSCVDFPDGIKWNKKGIIRTCSWIEGDPSTRCKKKKAKALCPNACGTTSSWCGSNLADAKGTIQINPTSTKYKGCAWVRKRPIKIENRCKKGNIALACRLTCKDYV